MMSGQFTEKQLDNFGKVASSLKLFSRAELNDEKNRSLIEKLYVDQLVGRRAKNLSDRTLVTRKQKGAIFSYKITEQAQAAYFGDPSEAELDLSDE